MEREIYHKEIPTYIKLILILSFPVIITLIVILTFVYGIIGFLIGMGLVILLLGPALILNVLMNKKK